MTLAQCLEEIKTSFLGGSTELMSKVGMSIIREIKLNHYPAGDFPRQGWFLLMQPAGALVVSNGKVSVNVGLNAGVHRSANHPLQVYSSK